MKRTEGTDLRVYAGPQLKERLRRLAFKRRVSMSALATTLLEEALEREDHERQDR